MSDWRNPDGGFWGRSNGWEFTLLALSSDTLSLGAVKIRLFVETRPSRLLQWDFFESTRAQKYPQNDDNISMFESPGVDEFARNLKLSWNSMGVKILEREKLLRLLPAVCNCRQFRCDGEFSRVDSNQSYYRGEDVFIYCRQSNDNSLCWSLWQA